MSSHTDEVRKAVEKRQEFVERVIEDLGGKKIEDPASYGTTPTSRFKENVKTMMLYRSVYCYDNRYYRVDKIWFERPCIVIECCDTWEEVLRFEMEDADPFPYDLSDEEIIKEVRYSLWVDPYPNPYPEWEW